MPNIGIDISLSSSIGTRGSGDGQFNYPSGIGYFNDIFIVVDRQNQRIQLFDSSFNFLSKFGTYGTGTGEMNFPEGLGVDSNNGNLYVSQSANHRISVYKPTNLLLEFGSKGAGDYEFNYPTDIYYEKNRIFVADKLNGKVKVYDILSYTPYFLFEISGLNFPEGVIRFNGDIYVTNSASKNIKIYDISGTYKGEITNPNFVYPTGLVNINNQIIGVIDKQGNSLYFYDQNGNLINEYSTGLFYPEHAIFVNNRLYVTDSGNHRVVIFDVFINQNISIFSETLVSLTRQLYPTGRAWWMKPGGIFHKLHQALSYSEGRAFQEDVNLLNAILPDNDSFSSEDAANWERVFGIVSNNSIPLDDRKKAIQRRIEYPGNIPARQDARYIESQLRKAGFDVYVFENHNQTYIIEQYQMGNAEMGDAEMGGDYQTIPFSVIANYIDENIDNQFVVVSQTFSAEMGDNEMNVMQMGDLGNTRDELLDFTFFVCGQNFLDTANVPANRKNEFRELLLKLKPANTIGYLIINYT